MKITAWFLSTTLVFTAAAHAENWPQWRGPNGDGTTSETGIPATWGVGKNIAWKLPLPGIGSSTPAVWNDHIFLTCADTKDDLFLLAVSTKGEELWKKKLGHLHLKARGDEGNAASPSVNTDGKNVYAFVGSGEIGAFDFQGNQIWLFNAQKRYGEFRIQFGMHSTPVLFDDKIFLAMLHDNGQWVIAIDKKTGRDVWKIDRKSDGREECLHSYASPTLWKNGKNALLIVHGNDYSTAHSLEDGHEVWRLGELNPKENYNATLRFVASPVATPDLIVVPTAKNGPVVAVNPQASSASQSGTASEQWRRPRDTPDVPSPLIHGGLVYLCRENGFVICMDAKSGHEFYNQRIHSSRYRASPVFADGKIYLTARDGVVTVIKSGPKFELVAENRLPDQFTASPVISGGRIYLRGFENLFAIGPK